jgi:hypothetical protein
MKKLVATVTVAASFVLVPTAVIGAGEPRSARSMRSGPVFDVLSQGEYEGVELGVGPLPSVTGGGGRAGR